MAKRQRVHVTAAFSATTRIAARCTPAEIARYRSRISGPLIDRIDIQIEVPALPTDDLVRLNGGEGSDAIRSRVEHARELMSARQGKENAKLVAGEIEKHCALDAAAAKLLRGAIAKFALSGRAYHRVLKVARTIADLAESARIVSAHVAEAIQYRTLDRAL